jgi:UDP-N-acetylmuramate dehydrogenase
MMPAFSDCDTVVKEQVPLAGYTSFRVGGPVALLLEPCTVAGLQQSFRRARQLGLPVRLLGGGTNLLVDDRGLTGAVIRTARLRQIDRTGSRVRAGGGVPLSTLLNRAVEWRLGGLEALAGIPGTVGGAVRMNSGRPGAEVAACVASVLAVGNNGRLRTLSRRQLHFGYRRSNLRDLAVAEVEFELTPSESGLLRESRERAWQEKKAHQPLTRRSAGCVFRNPVGASAGALIDAAHLKGFRCGDAAVSQKHANFIINRNQARCDDILRLIDRIRREVWRIFHIELELEIEIWKDSVNESN